MSRILIACGGTGGHLAPGIAVAQELVDRGHKCKLVITQKTVDQRLASAYPNLSFMALNSLPWTNKFWKWPGFFLPLNSKLLDGDALHQKGKNRFGACFWWLLEPWRCFKCCFFA